MIKRLVVAIILIVLVCGGIVGFNMFRAQAIDQFFANRKPDVMTVTATTVEAREWTPGIEAVGTAYSAEGVDVSAQQPGVVREIRFKANDRVTKGDVLVIQDDSVEQADLLSAQATLKRVEQALERVRKLAERGVSSQENLDNAKIAVDAAQANVEKVKATISQKWIKAPFSGVIGIPQIDLGQFLTPGTPIATLQDLDRIKVDFTVTEQEFRHLKMGQVVRVGSESESLDHEGTITGIDPKIDPQSRLVSVQAFVDNKDGNIQPGQFLRVRVELPTEANVIALPQTAITTSLYGDFVYRVDEQEAAPAATPGEKSADAAAPSSETKAPSELVAKQVFVKLGRRYLGLVEITQGVNVGETIVTGGQNKISNGSIIRIDNTVDPSKPGSQSGANGEGDR